MVNALNVFPGEVALVNLELVRRTYKFFEYITSKIFADLTVSVMFPLVFS